MGKFGAQKKRSLKGKKNLSALAKDAMQVDQNQNKSEEGSNDQLNEGKPVTRGAILQRHKREWRELRSQIQKLKDERRHIRGGSVDGKKLKKERTTEIKRMMNEFKLRTKKEIDEFDGTNGGAPAGAPQDVVGELSEMSE